MKRRSDTDDASTNKRQTVVKKVTIKKLSSMTLSLDKVTLDDKWKRIFRLSVNIIPQMRQYSNRVISDNI